MKTILNTIGNQRSLLIYLFNSKYDQKRQYHSLVLALFVSYRGIGKDQGQGTRKIFHKIMFLVSVGEENHCSQKLLQLQAKHDLKIHLRA